MSNVVVEHILLLPALIIIIILFPMAASAMMTSYHEQQRVLLMTGALNQFTSTMQELSYSLSQGNFLVGNITKTNPVPATIDAYYYELTASRNSDITVLFTMALQGEDLSVSKTMTPYPNVLWMNSTFTSSFPEAAINIETYENGTAVFSLIGGG